MIAYKGFNRGLECRGYQFHMGLNVTEEANCVRNGFHCAHNPLDCLRYYSDMEKSVYCVVNAGGDIDEDATDSKISCTELTILKKLSRREFFLHALAYMHDHPKAQWAGCVEHESGVAQCGYAVVRGKNPKARGCKGDILAIAKEPKDTPDIEKVALAIVDGKRLKPDVWYDITLSRCGKSQPSLERKDGL